MTFVDSVCDIMDKHGQTMQYSQDGEAFSPPYRAFIQPLRYKNKMYLDGKHSEIGYIDTSYYLYLGPADIDVAGHGLVSRLKIKK